MNGRLVAGALFVWGVMLGVILCGNAKAIGTIEDDLGQCHVSTNDPECEWAMGVFGGWRDVGDEFTVYIDYDVDTAHWVCGVYWWSYYEASRFEFVRAELLNPARTAGEVVECYEFGHPPTPDCPWCDTAIGCNWYDLGDLYVDDREEPEVALTFRLNSAGNHTLHAGEFMSYRGTWGPGGEGGAGPHECWTQEWRPDWCETPPDYVVFAMPVPEPGHGLMLAAGIPALGVLARRRR